MGLRLQETSPSDVLEIRPLDLTEILAELEQTRLTHRSPEAVEITKEVALLALFLQSRDGETLIVAEDEVTGILGGGEDDTWPPGTKANVTLKRGTGGLRRHIQVQKVVTQYEF